MNRRLLCLCASGLGAMAAACGGSPVAPPPAVEGPAVQSIAPSTGSLAGGTEVTIRGLRFAAGATVTLGGRAATDVTVQSSEALTARTPAGAATGTVDVVVSVSGRSGSLAGGFTYQTPPSNVAPAITSITAQGTRPRQPPDFADLGESITLSAAVSDPETPADQLEYRWSATLGTIGGSGRSVTWQAPASVENTPAQVTITLRVVERFGAGGVFQQEVSGTRVVRLHDSAREVGGMARRFLTEFSQPQTKRDWQDIMKDFSAAACPNPSTVESEREDVINHYTNFTMYEYTIGNASVNLDFGQGCVFIGNRFRPGDACVAVPVFWDSSNEKGVRDSLTGIDYLSATYSRADARWWLCSSDIERTGPFGHAIYR